uniref:Solute carrier family 5 member 6 n=1 Tax=Ciona savignyi TaxID=51511 RepID=H2YYA3_CIOSA
FAVGDYVVFCICLLLSLLIGIYYAITGGRQATTDEFLMANRKMSAAPVSVSLFVTIMSAITVLGVPAEVFQHGTSYWMFGFSYFLFTPIVAHCFIPVFYDMKITSVYEYLERRYSKIVRLCGVVSFILMMIVYMGVVLYAPSLAINAVTGLNVWISVVGLCLVCTIYTVCGGLKAVIWTDVFQVGPVIMVLAQIIVIAIGCNKLGGISKVFQIAFDAGKLAPINFDPSPFEAHTFWSLCIGGSFLCMSIYGVNQASVQRFLCCKTKLQAQISIYLNLPLLHLVMFIGCSIGLLIYSQYRCDNPLHYDTKPDQLLLYYVMNVLGEYPGIPGLFIACLFCASLRWTISSSFNSLATVTMTDIIRPHFKMADRRATIISKTLVCGYALLCLCMTLIASQMPSVLKAALSILGIMGGPMLSLFLLGIYCRHINHKGALAGFMVSMVLVFWVGFGSIVFRVNNQTQGKPPLFLEQACYLETNMTTPTIPPTFTQVDVYTGINIIYKLSYMWYSGFSFLISLLISTVVSLCTG